jgi:DNA helicase IV
LPNDEVAKEQAYVQKLYEKLDAEREHAADRLRSLLRQTSTHAGGLLERDMQITQLRDRRTALNAAEHALCFGRIDTDDGQRHYIGRLGLRSESGSGQNLLLDWRAPAARAFYLATAAAPHGLRRRRHLTTRGRRVVRVDDEPLGTTVDDSTLAEAEPLVGEGALVAALTAGRSGRMRDIVATLQREQDEAVRSAPAGVLVVQGGPGTGKTAVALHRAAYLLYSHPEIARRGVLVVGPSPTFLGYVGDVLPGLGETRAVLSTIGELVPGVRAERAEAPQVALLKGRAQMAEVIAAAVGDRQGLGGADRRSGAAIDVDGDRLTLSAAFLRTAIDQARATRLPHNQARAPFADRVLRELARQAALLVQRQLTEVEQGFEAEIAAADRALAAGLDALPGIVDSAGAGERADEAQLIRELAQRPVVRTLIDRLWPALTPQRLLEDLFTDPARLAVATAGLSSTERDLLARPRAQGWSEADIPLLDEAADLLGEDTRAEHRRAARAQATEIAYAQAVLDLTRPDYGGETLTADNVLNARSLASRHRPGDPRTLAERAAADLRWVYGHVVVDEAQELSPMAWRMLMRRCPSRSMTVVGDLAQTHSPSGAGSWQQALGPHVGDRLRLLRLTVNYRTPAEIMDAAARVLATAGTTEPAPRSVRRGGRDPWRAQLPADTSATELATALAGWAEREASDLTDGRIAILAPEPAIGSICAAVAARVPDVSYGPDVDLQRSVVVLTVAQAKGLEFDSVLVVDPATILAGPRGANDLYVAMTRATRSLALVHPGPAPTALETVPLTAEFAGNGAG